MNYYFVLVFFKCSETEVKRIWKAGELDISLITVDSLLKAEQYRK